MGRRRNKKRGQQVQLDSSTQGEFINDKLLMKSSNILGRYLVAKEDLRAGTSLISEEPIVLGPDFGGSPVCVNCYTGINLSQSQRCKNCNWPMCSEKCQELLKFHCHNECELLKASTVKPQNPDDNILFNILTPLRILILKDIEPDKWNSISKMESHNEGRKENVLQWDLNQRQIVDTIRKDCGYIQYSEELLHTICGYLQVNSFSIESTGLRGLYPTAYLMSHNCVPNTSHVFNENHKLTVIATTDIKTGENVTISYANTLEGTAQRRAHLKESKYFDCICSRCKDPTELGTHLSSLKCYNCQNGDLTAKNPLDKNTLWTCGHCGHLERNRNIEILISRIINEKNKVKAETVEQHENFIAKYSKILHENHFLMLSAKRVLSQLYGKVPNYMIDQMSEAQLRRKIDICKSTLKVFSVLEPGLSRIRGVTLYEMHAPLLVWTMKSYQAKKINKEALIRGLREIVMYLKEAEKILSFEPPTTVEGQIGKAAKQALIQAQQWESQMGKM